MTTMTTTAPVNDRPRGRLFLWLGIAAGLLGIGLTMLQFSLKQLVVPWHMPVLATIGAALVVYSLVHRRSVVRFIALGLLVILAGFQWFFLVSLARLPEYTGPARPGQAIPAFQTKLSDGRSFTEKDLRDGTSSVLTFFRGRW